MNNRKPSKNYIRVCKRCLEEYPTTKRTSKICPKCSRFNFHINNSNSSKLISSSVENRVEVKN